MPSTTKNGTASAGLGRIIALCAAAFGLGLAAFSLSRVLWLSLPLMRLTGMAMMIQMAGSNTLLQTLTDEDKRGRVMSFYAMAFFGTAPLGSLMAGAMADRLGAPDTILIGGLACIAGALVFWRQLPGLRKWTRPIYVRLGVLSDSADCTPSTPQLRVPPED